jgi:hypothetical protein
MSERGMYFGADLEYDGIELKTSVGCKDKALAIDGQFLG